MSTPAAHRATSATALEAALPDIAQLRTFVGLDGFVDEIVHIVDKRHDAYSYDRLRTISCLAERIGAAAGRSTNIERVPQQTKLGGNGPIMANTLSTLGCQVTYLGALGHPNVDPVFDDFASRADVHSIAPAGSTIALEFDDGKIMVPLTVTLNEITWDNIGDRFGHDCFLTHMAEDQLVGFVNWTMIPAMNAIWESLLNALPSTPPESRSLIFFDLADPEKRTREDIRQALTLITRFEQHF